MPSVLQSYLDYGDYLRCQEIQSAIIDTYRNDFGKYGNYSDLKFLQLVFAKAPGLIGHPIKYTHISSEYQSRDLKRALHHLYDAGILTPVYCSSASGLPLNAGKIRLSLN